MEKGYLVSKGDQLIRCHMKSPLTAREQKLILTAVSMIDWKAKELPEVTISMKKYCELLELQSTKYTAIKNFTDNLMTKVISIPLPDGNEMSTHWVSNAIYMKGEGRVILSFDPKLKPYLLDLSKFTQYKLENILSLDSTYSIRIYEILRQWAYGGSWEGSLESLRKMVGFLPKSYDLYGNFKSKVLDVAIKEINEKTDLIVSYEEIKKGRKVVAIKFFIKEKKRNKEKKVTSHKKQKIIREEQIPATFEKRNSESNSIYEKFSKEEIDIMRKELMLDLEKSKEENSNK